EQKNVNDLKVILKDLRTAANNIDKYGKILNNANVTMHDVNSMATIKIAYDLIYTTLEKIFNKGVAPSNYSSSINGCQNHQTINSNGTQILNTYNSAHETWHSFDEEPKKSLKMLQVRVGMSFKRILESVLHDASNTTRVFVVVLSHLQFAKISLFCSFRLALSSINAVIVPNDFTSVVAKLWVRPAAIQPNSLF
ncbi:Uncharacterized protein FWK35_00014612, partial [Aphis craccivora]